MNLSRFAFFTAALGIWMLTVGVLAQDIAPANENEPASEYQQGLALLEAAQKEQKPAVRATQMNEPQAHFKRFLEKGGLSPLERYDALYSLGVVRWERAQALIAVCYRSLRPAVPPRQAGPPHLPSPADKAGGGRPFPFRAP